MFTGIKKDKDIEAVKQKLKELGKKGLPIVEKEDGNYSINYVSFEDKKGKSEMHENADDVYYVLEGSAKLKLKGEIVDKQEKGPGEFIGTDLKDAEEKTMEKGDIVSIPRKTPHVVDASGSKITYLVIKVY